MRPNSRSDFSIMSIPTSNGPVELQRLADQVSQIAQKISHLGSRIVDTDSIEKSDLDITMLRRMVAARRARGSFFPEGLFADPAWDILLDLLIARLTHVRVSVSTVCVASNVPQTTALRWIKTLEAEGLVVRRADRHDGRRFHLELTLEAEHALQLYFGSIGFDFAL